jgi:hypothetical protein
MGRSINYAILIFCMVQVGVVGASACDDETYMIAYKVGELLAEKGCVIINGGLGGVMEASARGAKSKGGLVIGILPTAEKRHANPYIDVAIATNMGHARNIIIVHSSDALIAIGGGYGTACEVAIALKEKKRVVAINPSFSLPDLVITRNAEDAVKKVLGEVYDEDNLNPVGCK